ncbi:MAG: hypothetical protein ABI406_13690, partial [Ktedonobacteraceae bacterium]
AKLTGWRVDVTRPAEGEVFEEPADNGREPATTYAARRDRGDRRHDRGERGGGERSDGNRRSGGHRGGTRHQSSSGYDEE